MRSPARVPSQPRGRALALLVGIVVLCIPVEALAQVRVLDPGTRVRVRLAGAKSDVVANILEARRDTLVLVRPSAAIESRLPMPLARIQRLEVSAGRHRLTLIGALLGGLAGAGVVGVYNSITQSQCFGNCPEPMSFLVGGGVGIAVGGIGFHFIQKDRWVEVSLPAPGRR